MINKITAAIDIGSYNCRMIIVNNSPKIKILKKISVPTNLIKNLSYNNEFTHKNIQKTVKCLTMFSRKMLEYNVTKYRCVATEACRQVINSDFFTREVTDQFGDNRYAREIAPFEPIYMAGYIQDKFAVEDLIFNIGLRVDRYDANQQVLKDRYVLYPTYTA